MTQTTSATSAERRGSDMSRTRKTVHEHTGKRCPVCRSVVLTDGDQVWCSFVGSFREKIPPCTYGLEGDVVSVSEHESGVKASS